MGAYIYTARATGRVPVWVRGDIEWVFPLEFSFKPNIYDSKNTDRWFAQAERQANRIEAREDWSGYVSLYGSVYRSNSAYFSDAYGDSPDGYVGQLVKVGKEWYVQ